ncbi:MAG: peptide deformylase [Desulfobulbaceae bacterium]|nr:peptide deformylase [Desulfobulbaceae bacterium]
MKKLRYNGSPALFSVAEEVSEDVKELIADMWDVMYLHKGIGLAANQIGVLKRVIVIHCETFRQAFINPVITRRYGGKGLSREGCLSYPGIRVGVFRYKNIVVEGTDEKGAHIKRKLKGHSAYCVQHEIDHLNGVTIKDIK